MSSLPRTAIVAVTLNCNSRCVMCDIWKNDIRNELDPEDYRKLPPTLRDINITGGEPFLRLDLPHIVRVLKETCPDARIIISSHGFMTDRIQKMIPELLEIDPALGIRISIDGDGKKHEDIRGIPKGFEKTQNTLKVLREAGLRDLGIAMTVMHQNKNHLLPLYKLANQQGWEFSLTVVTDSTFYYGEGKQQMRPSFDEPFERDCKELVTSEYRSWHPKRWLRAWFDSSLWSYLKSGKRPFECDAGSGSFYVDSFGSVYGCHVLPTRLGNLRDETFGELWHSQQADHVRKTVIEGCNQCWMICSARSAIRKNWVKVGFETLAGKTKAHLFP